ncbi:hypothetical protein TNCV_1137791 [Trichonephila clavipes]|nr:hypothetical protein TNCV_1137791 [Trichonephila clavipes]
MNDVLLFCLTNKYNRYLFYFDNSFSITVAYQDKKLKKKKTNKALERSIMEAEKAAKMPKNERLKTYSFAVRYKGKWGKTKACARIPVSKNSAVNLKQAKEARIPVSKNSAVNLKQAKEDKEEIGGRKRRRGSKINDPKKKDAKKRISSNSKAPKIKAPESTSIQNSFEDSDKYSSEVEMSVADEDDSRIGQTSEDDDDDDDETSRDSDGLRKYTAAESDYVKTLERVFRPSYISNKVLSPDDSERYLQKFLKEAKSLNNDPKKIRLIDINKYID